MVVWIAEGCRWQTALQAESGCMRLRLPPEIRVIANTRCGQESKAAFAAKADDPQRAPILGRISAGL
ncbi:hypothetical protein ACLB0R_10745 [Sphingomonas sp. GlSt437]|uniref:hypothetical protein n=1 Tax=Sphingomonas sp. GlSt437 TaxID=3389970 RepID=UPI003EC0FEB6